MKVIAINSENKLIEAAKDNDRLSQQKLYARFSPKMLAVCRYYLKDVQQAEDVMIAGFLKCFLKINMFSSNGSFEGWLRQIMVRECIDFLRVKKNSFNHSTIDDFQVEDSNETIDLLSEQNIEVIQQCIENLPAACKLVFTLYVIEEYKHKEIAEMLEISIGTSKKQLSIAKVKIKEQLKNNPKFKTL